MQRFTSQDFNWTTKAMLWIIVFISCLDSHSDGTHSLYRGEWYNANFLQICSNEKKNHLNFGWPEGEYFQQMFIFGWTIPIKVL